MTLRRKRELAVLQKGAFRNSYFFVFLGKTTANSSQWPEHLMINAFPPFKLLSAEKRP